MNSKLQLMRENCLNMRVYNVFRLECRNCSACRTPRYANFSKISALCRVNLIYITIQYIYRKYCQSSCGTSLCLCTNSRSHGHSMTRYAKNIILQVCFGPMEVYCTGHSSALSLTSRQSWQSYDERLRKREGSKPQLNMNYV